MAAVSGTAQRTGAQSAERVLRVLEEISASPDGLDAGQIAAALGLAPSTTYRLVSLLQREGYVSRQPGGSRFVLGRTVDELSIAQRRQVLATPAVRSLLAAAHDEARAPFYLTTFYGDEILMAHIADSPAVPRIAHFHVGFTELTAATAFGKLMLAAKSEEALAEFVDRAPLPAYTRNTVTDAAELRRQLAALRHERVAIEVEEYMPNIACVAAPVRSSRGALVGAVSLSTDVADFSARLPELERIARRTALQVGAQLRA